MQPAAKPGQGAQQASGPSLELIDFSGFWTASYGEQLAPSLGLTYLQGAMALNLSR